MDRITGPLVRALERAVTNGGWLERMAARQSKIGDRVVFDPSVFPWHERLEAEWQTIRGELDRVMQRVETLPNFQDLSPRQRRIADDDRWKTYFLCAFGCRSERNCQECPRTTALLDGIPGLKVAFFSILAPGKHIPSHYGKHKGLIRYHLGLRIPGPAGACRIRIADQVCGWEEGRSLVFDNTHEHEVWNDTADYRAVLFLDIARPLRFPMSALNWLVNRLIAASPIIQQAKRNYQDWEAVFDQRPQSREGGPAAKHPLY